MSEIAEALHRMGIQHQTMLRSFLAVRVDTGRECKKLAEVAKDFAERGTQARVHTSLMDPKQVWRDFISRKYDLTALDARQIKTLCYAPETATMPELHDAFSRFPDPLTRTGCLMGLIFSYFSKWGDIRQQDAMESLIRTALKAYTRKNPLMIEYRRNSDLLFQRAAAEALAARTLIDWETPRVVLDQFRIASSSNLSAATTSATIRRFLATLAAPRTSAEGLGSLKYAIKSLIVPELPTQEFYATVSSLIVRPWVEAFPECQTELRRYILEHKLLGDPRIQTAHWSTMDRAAHAKFLQWIARESIVFFFNHVLPDNSVNERRKNFWLEYVHGLQDFQVALSDLHYNRLVATARLSEVPGFARVNHYTTSAFIMRFHVAGGEDVIVVEFSETGNAAHGFRAAGFEAKAGKIRSRRFDFANLKHHAKESRIVHRGEWEYAARNKLASWGVRR